MLKGKAGILIPTLREVANELGVSAGSLLDPLNQNGGKGQIGELEDERARPPAGARTGLSRVPLTRGAGIAAGAGANVNTEYVADYVPFRDDWLSSHGLTSTRCQVIEVLGDSMEPTLEHRSVILVDFQRTARRRNTIFALRTEDGPVVKRLQRDEDGWWLISDNPAYRPIPWPRDAQVLGQVMWTGRTL